MTHASAFEIDRTAAGLQARSAHVEACAECHRRLVEAERERTDIAARPEFAEVRRSLPAESPRIRRLLMPLALALAGAAAVLLLVPRRVLRPKGSADIALEGEARVGQVVELRVRPGAHAYAIVVEQSSGAVLFKGAVPRAGASVQLRVTPGEAHLVALFGDAPFEDATPRPGVERRELAVRPLP